MYCNMKKLKLEFPEHFFEGEERSGYYISPKMKKIWAVELDLLNELQRVFKKYDIKYFAGEGTLLGAVRHKGMIPWDDDIDLYMKRSEFDRFVKIARNGAFNKPYFWFDHFTDPTYLGSPLRLMNLDTTAIDYRALNERHGKITEKSGIFVDIFPLDNLPDNLDERLKWNNRIQMVARKAWNLRMFKYRGLLQDDEETKWLDFWFSLTNNPNQLFEKYYELLSENAYDTTEYCTIYSHWIRNPEKTNEIYKNSDFNEGTLSMKFEMLEIPVPLKFDSILTQRYGNYLTPTRGTSGHKEGLFFDVNHPFTYYIDQLKGIKKERVREALETK